MNALTFIDRKTLERLPYYKGRWPYIKRVIQRIESLDGIERVLELGPGPVNRSIVDGADTMGIRNFAPLKGQEGRLTIVHDASIAPWPVADNAYDLFLALQVFEHLGNKQREAFAEARRVARFAILSLPYFCKSERHRLSHADYIRWFGLPTDIEIVDNLSCRKAILFFDFSRPNGSVDIENKKQGGM